MATHRKLKHVEREIESCSKELATHERLVELKEKIDQISDCVVAQTRLLPSTLDLWKNIVQLRIKLFRLGEKEKKLKQQLQREKYDNIDFTVLDKYKRFKKIDRTRLQQREEERKHEHSQNVIRHELRRSDRHAPKAPEGFTVRFSLDNAYSAIQRQEHFLSRPKLPPCERASPPQQRAMYVMYDRDKGIWKEVLEDKSERVIEAPFKQVGFLPSVGLSFDVQQELRRLNKTHGSVPPSSKPQEHKVASRNKSVNNRRLSTVLQEPDDLPDVKITKPLSPFQFENTSRTSSQEKNLHSKSKGTIGSTTTEDDTDAIEERLKKFSVSFDRAIIDKDIKESSGQRPKPGSTGHVRDNTKPGAAPDVEQLKMVASKITQLHDELKNEEENDQDATFKSCRYMYRLRYCRCLTEPSRLFEEDTIKNQVVGTIDILGHDDEGMAGPADACPYCQLAPAATVRRWVAAVERGQTTGVYGAAEGFSWFNSAAY